MPVILRSEAGVASDNNSRLLEINNSQVYSEDGIDGFIPYRALVVIVMVETVSPKPDAKAVAELIGKEYVESDTLPYEDSHKAEILYNNIGELCRSLADRIPVPVEYQAEDPYSGYEDMAKTVGREQKLRVYNQHTAHPFFSHEQQLAFRAVHDWYGHLSADVDFTPEGEYKKYMHMRKHFRPEENRVMFAEVVGQVGAVHYLPDGFEDSRYNQRAFLAPERWMDMMNDAVF